jgi:hypothetical protein
VAGFPEVALKATLGFTKELKENGSIAAVEVVPARKPDVPSAGN